MDVENRVFVDVSSKPGLGRDMEGFYLLWSITDKWNLLYGNNHVPCPACLEKPMVPIVVTDLCQI
jgi:hypothetical protein